MPKDVITDGAARLGLATGAVVLAEAPDGTLRAAAGENSVPLGDPAYAPAAGLAGYLAHAAFDRVSNLVSEALAAASLDDPAAFDGMIRAVLDAGSSGLVLLAPPAGQWPDAAVAAVPWSGAGAPGSPVERCFPALPLLDLVSAAIDGRAPIDANDITEWCAANPDNLIMLPEPDGGIRYAGWNRSLDRRCSLRAAMADFSRPWRISKMPDGSEEIVPAVPLRLADPVLNCYEAI